MKKGKLIVIILFTLMHFSTVLAESFPNHLPGGKNYIDPENITQSNDAISSIESIRVKPNQTYTLSFPEQTVLGGNIYVLIEGNTTYIDEHVANEVCTEIDNRVVCSFTTTIDETHIMLFISSELMSLYYQYYGLDLFQLEEGSLAT